MARETVLTNSNRDMLGWRSMVHTRWQHMYLKRGKKNGELAPNMKFKPFALWAHSDLTNWHLACLRNPIANLFGRLTRCYAARNGSSRSDADESWIF